MPTKGNKHRGIRMEDELWHEFLAATGAAGENASSVVRGLVREWLDNYKQGEVNE